jgi:SRSO17 transposase
MVPLGGTTLAGGSDSSCRLGQFPTAADIPAEYRTARTKPELALAEIDHAIAAGVRFGCVLADAGYGLSAPFRQGLTGRKLAWAVGIPRHLKGCRCADQMIWPVPACGRPRQRHVPDVLSIAAEDMLADARWQNISWRAVTKGKAQSSIRRVRVRRRPAAADQGQGSATSASGRGLAYRRAQCRERRNTISPTCRRRRA